MAILRERHFSEYQFEKNFYQKIHFGKYRNLLSKNYVCFRILSFFETRRFLKNDIMFFDYFFFFVWIQLFWKFSFQEKIFLILWFCFDGKFLENYSAIFWMMVFWKLLVFFIQGDVSQYCIDLFLYSASRKKF